MKIPKLRNEADVREDVAAPLLKTLGYARGAENGIEREYLLRYDRLQLGRKKPNDLPLGGKADYLLTVAGVGRWVLETKPPGEEIDRDTIDQTISYARHPEVSAHYAAILNGKRFVVFDRLKSSNEKPLLDVEVGTGETLAKQVEALLSPEAIRRDCAPPVVDLGAPLAKGFRSRAHILGGEFEHLDNRWDFPNGFDQQAVAKMEAESARLIGTISTVNAGDIWRDEASRIRARLRWNLPHQDLAAFWEQSRFNDVEYVCLDDVISDDPQSPSVFEFLSTFRVEAGLPVFSVLRWRTEFMQVPAESTITGQAAGFLCGDRFAGIASIVHTIESEPFPGPIGYHYETKFSLKVDTR